MPVTKKNKTIIIAEAGVNHNGNMNLAYKLIDIAAESKADYIKFQQLTPSYAKNNVWLLFFYPF
jgi:sialic acid synthase SpsE